MAKGTSARRPGKVRAFRSFDRSPIRFGILEVDGVDYAIQYYFRMADGTVVMSSTEMGGVGPVYSKSEDEAREQLIQMIRDRRDGKTQGWTEPELFYNSRNGDWERRHGYGDGSKLSSGVRKYRPRVDSHKQIRPAVDSGGDGNGKGVPEDQA